MNQSEIESYFYNETKGLEISKIALVETKNSYLWTIDCYLIETIQGPRFYVFDGDVLPINLYPITKDESLNQYYYLHIGLMSELCSMSIANNFILRFLDCYSIFPIIDRRMAEIENDITLDKNASQLSGIANQIRDCYLTLSDYLMNKTRSKNPSFKNDNFTDNLEEFLKLILPGKQSETRRNTINGISQKGWKLNSELIHKDSVTIFDVLTSFNIFQLIVSIICNLIVGNNMPFNKIKCPTCQGEEYNMIKTDKEQYEYICKNCNTHFSVALEDIIKRFDSFNL